LTDNLLLDQSLDKRTIAVYTEPIFNQHHFVEFKNFFNLVKQRRDRRELQLVSIKYSVPGDVTRLIGEFLPIHYERYEYQDLPNLCGVHRHVCQNVCEFCGECLICRTEFEIDHPYSKRRDECYEECRIYNFVVWDRERVLSELKRRMN